MTQSITVSTRNGPDDRQMRHMFAGRVVSQHVMLFEPILYGTHLRALSRLVDRYVLTPLAAGEQASYDLASVALVRWSEREEIPDGEWPAFADSVHIAKLAVSGDQHRVLVCPGTDNHLPALREAVALLDRYGLGVFVELAVGGLHLGGAGAATEDIRDALFLPIPETSDRTSAVEIFLARIFGAIARLWVAPEPEIRERLACALEPITPEDVFVAGCALELVKRASERGDDLGARLPGLLDRVQRTCIGLPPAAHDLATEMKADSLFAELLLCWWPETSRAVHLFTSHLDYLTRHPALDPAGSGMADAGDHLRSGR